MNHNEKTTVYDCCSVRCGGVSGSQIWQSDDGSGDHVLERKGTDNGREESHGGPTMTA